MPRGRPNPPSQIADGGGIHLGPNPEILEQDRPELDQPKGRLAPGDDGVHAGTVAVVGADAAVAVAVQRGGVAAAAAVTLASDQVDERFFLDLLQRIPRCIMGGAGLATGTRHVKGLWRRPER